MRLRAYAKINLALEITGKRPDGYHDLASIMQTVGLWDDLTLQPADDLTFVCPDPALAGDDNLVLRAARLLKAEAGVTAGAHLSLLKRIPVAAGLAGGSSDAAAALHGLNLLWSLGYDARRLAELGARVGSDVPFLVYGGTALVGGRGELVEPLPAPHIVWYTLCKPDLAVPTGAVFADLPASALTDGRRTLEIARRVRDQGTVAVGPNGLRETLFRLYPQAQACFHHVAAVAPGRAFVSGSGPTVVVVSARQDDARRVAAAVEGEGWWTAVAPAVQTGSCIAED